MSEQMIREQQTPKYQVKLKTGMVLSALFESRFSAEQFLLALPVEQRIIAEIVPVTTEGQQILFG